MCFTYTSRRIAVKKTAFAGGFSADILYALIYPIMLLAPPVSTFCFIHPNTALWTAHTRIVSVFYNFYLTCLLITNKFIFFVISLLSFVLSLSTFLLSNLCYKYACFRWLFYEVIEVFALQICICENVRTQMISVDTAVCFITLLCSVLYVRILLSPCGLLFNYYV